MNLHKSIVAATALLGLAVALPSFADEDKSVTVEKTTTTKHHYVYYPEHDIYFAPDTKTYYYQANGSWTSGTSLPAEDMPYIKSRSVQIELDTDRPYERHDYVIAHYKNKLHNKVDKDDDHDRDQ